MEILFFCIENNVFENWVSFIFNKLFLIRIVKIRKFNNFEFEVFEVIVNEYVYFEMILKKNGVVKY